MTAPRYPLPTYEFAEVARRSRRRRELVSRAISSLFLCASILAVVVLFVFAAAR